MKRKFCIPSAEARPRLGGRFVILLAVFIIGSFGSAQLYAQTQPYQKSTTPAYVDTTYYDTVACPGLSGVKRTGVITNESYTISLDVYFAKRDSLVRDANSYMIVMPRSKVRFSFYGNKIFRRAQSDSVYTQIIFGDDIDISVSPLWLFEVPVMQQADTGHYWRYDTLSSAAMDTLIIPPYAVRGQAWFWFDSLSYVSTDPTFPNNGNTFLVPGGSWNWNYYAGSEFDTLYIKKYSGAAGEVKWAVDIHYY